MRQIIPRKHLPVYVAAFTAIAVLSGCQAAEHRPAGVSRFISFSVSPVYPKSFDIVAGAQHSFYGHFSVEELKEAWRKKAVEVAKGKKFKISSLVVHDNETDYAVGWPMKSRSVSGTITLTD